MAKKLVTLSKEVKESLDAIRKEVAAKDPTPFFGKKLLQLHEVWYAITGIVPNNGCGSQCVTTYLNIVYNYITHHELRTDPVVVVATTAKVVQSPVKKNDGILNAPGLKEAISTAPKKENNIVEKVMESTLKSIRSELGNEKLPTTKPELWKLAKEKGYKGNYQKSTEKQLTEFIQSK